MYPSTRMETITNSLASLRSWSDLTDKEKSEARKTTNDISSEKAATLSQQSSPSVFSPIRSTIVSFFFFLIQQVLNLWYDQLTVTPIVMTGYTVAYKIIYNMELLYTR